MQTKLKGLIYTGQDGSGTYDINAENVVLGDTFTKKFTVENITDEILYEINLKDLFKNQKIEIYIPKETIIDNSNNTNNEQTIKYEV